MTGTQAALLASRGIVRATGADARDFLQDLVTNDMTHVSPEHAIYAALLTPQGKVLFDFFIVEWGDGFLLDAPALRTADLVTRLMLYKLRAKVEIEDASAEFDVTAIWGSLSGLELDERPGATLITGNNILFVDPRLAALGARAIVPGAQAEDFLGRLDAERASESDYDDYRLSLGVPDSVRDMAPNSMFLLEADFEELNGVDFQKGCYIGQEQTSRMKRRATARKRLVPVSFDGPAPANGTAIKAGGREIGTLCSTGRSRGIALVRLQRVGEALASGESFTCDGTVVTPEVPGWASFEFTSDLERDEPSLA